MGRESRNNPNTQAATGRSRTTAYDRFGRPLQTGDVVYLINKQDVMWRVVATKPVLHPGAPPNTVEVQLVAAFVTGVPGGHNIVDLLKVGDAEGQPPVTDDMRELTEEVSSLLHGATPAPAEPDSGPQDTVPGPAKVSRILVP